MCLGLPRGMLGQAGLVCFSQKLSKYNRFLKDCFFRIAITNPSPPESSEHGQLRRAPPVRSRARSAHIPRAERREQGVTRRLRHVNPRISAILSRRSATLSTKVLHAKRSQPFLDRNSR